MSEGLSDRQRLFVAEYAKDLCATRAYKAAGYKVKSEAVANVCASKLLATAKVRAAVEDALRPALQKAELSMEQTLDKLRQFLTYDVRKMFRPDGTMIPVHELPDDLAAACVGWKDTIAGREVKFADKVAALEKAMKYHGLFEKDNKQTADAITEVMFSFMSPGGKVEPASG